MGRTIRMKGRRVVFLQHDSNPLGGVGRVLLTLVKGLQRQGYESHVVLPEAGGLEAELAKVGAAVRVIPTPVFPVMVASFTTMNRA